MVASAEVPRVSISVSVPRSAAEEMAALRARLAELEAEAVRARLAELEAKAAAAAGEA